MNSQAIIASTVISPTMILSPSEYSRGWQLVFGSYAGSDGNELVIDFDCDSYDGVGTYYSGPICQDSFS